MKRFCAAVVAAAWGLVVGATLASAVGTVQVLLSPGLEMASTPRALIVGPLMTMAEGLFWCLLGGAMYVFPPAVVAFAIFRPPNTTGASFAVSAILLVPVVVVGFRGRPATALLLALPVWLGVRVALRLFSRMTLTPTARLK
jgi:hypothetical protein